MKKTLIAFSILVVVLAKLRYKKLKIDKPKLKEVVDEGKDYEIKYFTNKIDHFSFMTDENLGFTNTY